MATSDAAAQARAEPAVSFVMPVFNVERYIGKCLDSLRGQTRGDIEIIVVDDGSTDGSLNVCHQHAAQDDRLRIVSQPNQGQGVARNHGLAIAAGRYVCFVDPDDWVDAALVADLVAAMDASQADFGNFGLVFVNEDGSLAQAFPVPQSRALQGDDILLRSMLDRDILTSSCNKIYARHFLQAHPIAFPPLRAYEDAYFSRVMAAHARSCIFVDKVYYFALLRLGSTSRTMKPANMHIATEVLHRERLALQALMPQRLPYSVFDAHQVKFLTHLLVLAAFRVASWGDFKATTDIARASGHHRRLRDAPTMAHLKRKNRWVAQATRSPLLCWWAAKLLASLGRRPY